MHCLNIDCSEFVENWPDFGGQCAGEGEGDTETMVSFLPSFADNSQQLQDSGASGVNLFAAASLVMISVFSMAI